eukprot:79561-Pelagomonas_calceolata.AAC.3
MSISVVKHASIAAAAVVAAVCGRHCVGRQLKLLLLFRKQRVVGLAHALCCACCAGVCVRARARARSIKRSTTTYIGAWRCLQRMIMNEGQQGKGCELACLQACACKCVSI